jgi:hypothetical protein
MIAERRRRRELIDVEIGKRIPAHGTAVQLRFVNQLCAIPPQKVQFREADRADERRNAARAKLGVSLEPTGVLHQMIEQHGVRLGDRVVA